MLSAICVLAGLFGVKLLTGVGPDLPGPRLREVVGLEEGFALCQPTPDTVRRPTVPVRGSLTWHRAGTLLPLRHDELRAATAGGLVYVGGGAVPNEDGTFFASLDSFFSYDPRSRRLERLPSLPIPLDHTVIGSWHGDIFVFGGRSSGLTSDRAFRYSPAERMWSELARMPEPRVAGAGATIGDRFYFVGGALENALENPGASRDLFVYDFGKDRWTRGAPMSARRHHVAAAALAGKLYVVGGRSDTDLSLSSVERYDPGTGAWESTTPLPLGSGGLGVVSLGGRILAISGGDDGERWVTPATWSLDPQTEAWTRQGDITLPRHGFAAAVVHGRTIVLGGSPCPRSGRTGLVEVSSGSPR